MANLTPKSPQEVEVLYILPAIRRDLSLNLKGLGLEQKAIAKLLNVSEPAISQYMSSKRASQVRFPKKIQDEIKKVAERIMHGKDENGQLPMLEETQHLVRLSLLERTTCGICQVQVAGVPVGCTACFK